MATYVEATVEKYAERLSIREDATVSAGAAEAGVGGGVGMGTLSLAADDYGKCYFVITSYKEQ